jgi:hypothetical protein
MRSAPFFYVGHSSSFQSQSYGGDKTSGDEISAAPLPSAPGDATHVVTGQDADVAVATEASSQNLRRSITPHASTSVISGNEVVSQTLLPGDHSSPVVVLRMFLSPELDEELNGIDWMWNGRPERKLFWGIERGVEVTSGAISYKFTVPSGLIRRGKSVFGQQLRANIGEAAGEILGKPRLDALLRQYKTKSKA